MGHYNNKGQRDGSKGNYSPPNGPVNELLFGWTQSSSRQMQRENREYNAGYHNGKRGR